MRRRALARPKARPAARSPTATLRTADISRRRRGEAGAIRARASRARASPCLEEYFHRSSSSRRLWLAADTERAAGLLLQRLPEADEDQEEDWARVQALASTLDAPELLGTPAETLLARVFPRESVRVFRPASPHFHCPCSRTRI